MTITSVLILAGILAAFIVFAVVLAWGERQTRGLERNAQAQQDGATSLLDGIVREHRNRDSIGADKGAARNKVTT